MGSRIFGNSHVDIDFNFIEGSLTWITVNPRKLEHGFRRICARIPYTLP